MKRLKLSFVLLSAVLLFNTCSEPIDFIGEVTTTVMAANDMFLEVTEVLYPSPNSTDANPGSQVVVQFDRAIDIASVTSGSIKITNITDSTSVDIQNPSFNAINRQLVFEPSELSAVGYFLDDRDYTIELVSLRGADGSRLRESYLWSFHTGTAPAGSVSVSDGGITGTYAADAGFTNELSIQVEDASHNAAATRYYATLDESELTTPASIGGWEDVGLSFSLDLPETSQDGQKYVYAIFTDAAGEKFSRPVSGVISLDKTAPQVDAGDDVVLNTGFTRTADITEANVKTMQWIMTSEPFMGDLDFGSPASATTSINPNSIDGVYTIRFTVRDKAGNSAFDTMSYTVDREPPGAPSITTSIGNTASTSLRWDWDAGSGIFSNYQRSLNSGTWYDTLSVDYTYIIPRLASGVGSKHTLRVRAEDAAGNVSDYDSYSISYFPSTDAYLIPYNGAIKVSQSTNIDWPDFSGATGYLWYKKKSTALDWEAPVQVSTSFYNPPINLLSDTTYNWYYKPYATKTTNILGISPVYSFTTIR